MNSCINGNHKEYVEFNGRVCAIHTFNVDSEKKFGDFVINKIEKDRNGYEFECNFIMEHGDKFFFSFYNQNDFDNRNIDN